MKTAVVLISFGFPRIVAQFASKIFTHMQYGKRIATVLLFAETFNREVSNVLYEKPIFVELLIELRIVVIQDSEDGKRTVCKQYNVLGK